MRIIEYSAIGKNTLLGVCTVEHPSGMVLHGVQIHRKNDSVWASPASRPRIGRDKTQMTGTDGKPSWEPIVSFTNREVREKWSLAVVEALREARPEVLA